jgi:integrase
VPLTLYRRHTAECQHYGKPRNAPRTRNCQCPLWVQGSLGRAYVRRSLDLRSWEAASELVLGWDAAGKIGAVTVEVPTISKAVEDFLHDLEHGQQRKAPTISKHKNLLDKRLIPWCASRRYSDLRQLDVAAMREFRASWPDSPISATKNLERLRSFFRFCVDANWLETNPAAALKPPKVGKASERVKVFAPEEIKRILKACDRYPERNSFGHDNPARVRAFVLTLRYSGLRIGDVVGLRRSDLHRARLLVKTAKTGEPVYVPLPPDAVDALKDVQGDDERFFWTGKGLQKSAVADWQRALRRVFKDAKVTGNPHMFRHTFATDLLSRGVPIEDVAILLGHATPAITSKYYAHFVKARRERLEERIKALWA